MGGAVLHEIKHVLVVKALPQSGSLIPQTILLYYFNTQEVIFGGLEVKLGTFSVSNLTNPTFFVRNSVKNSVALLLPKSAFTCMTIKSEIISIPQH